MIYHLLKPYEVVDIKSNDHLALTSNGLSSLSACMQSPMNQLVCTQDKYNNLEANLQP